LYSPVGNRVRVYNLEENVSKTVAHETRSNIRQIVVSSNDSILIAIDIEGHSIIVNLLNETLVNRFNFKSRV